VATIQVKRSHRLSKEAAREAAASVAEQLRKDLGIAYRWEHDRLHFSRPGARGYIDVEETEVRVSVTLSWVLAPLKSEIDRQVEEYLHSHLD
jgi:putative polyhydroxyalkanoate system protein